MSRGRLGWRRFSHPSSSLKAVFGAHIASAFNFKIELENIILVALRTFEFSHSLGPKATKLGTLRWSADQGQTGRVPGANDYRGTLDLPTDKEMSAYQGSTRNHRRNAHDPHRPFRLPQQTAANGRD